ncbi:MAG: DUF3467 domain-containing protein [Candidatus Acidiferrum sp.]
MTDIMQRPLTPEDIRERTQSDRVPILYYNYVRVAASFFDIRLFLGQGNVTPKGEQTFEEQICVTCSPEFAKTLRDNLNNAVQKYEQMFGEIKSVPTAAQLQALVNSMKSPAEKNKQ